MTAHNIRTYASRKTVRSLYVHVPFCLSRCAYCDFYSVVPQDRALVTDWHEGVLLELQRIAEESVVHGVEIAPLETLYFGGGTPTVVSPSMVANIIREARSLFQLAPECEITVEANPESLLRPIPCAKALREAGVTRISLGAQSASDASLRLAGRLHTADDTVNAVLLAHEAGFDAISCDFITGLPDETMKDIDAVLEMVNALPLNHVSIYALSIVSDTRFGEFYRKFPERFPGDEIERRMTHRLIAGLESSGFQHYEISNFARPGAESRHNTVYWQADPYFAAGPSASSYMGGVRRTNPLSIDKWLRHLYSKEEGPFGRATIDEIVDEDAARVETVILGLRLLRGVSRAVFRERHGISLDKLFSQTIESLIAKGLIDDDSECIRLTSRGLDFADEAARAFL
jgi:oxygen-independent coproporphyrinogen-3 oxidase